MGTALNAFGLYSNYRHPRYRYEKIGTEAIVSDFGIRFFRGQYVVDIKAGDSSERTNEGIHNAAQRISERIEAPAEFPEILTLLPSEGRVERTLRYVAQEMLNQSFLPGGMEARYRVDGEEVAGFVVLFDSHEVARNGFEALREFFKKSDDEFVFIDLGEANGFGVKTSYHGYVLVTLEGRFLAGVQDLSSPKKGIGLLLSITNRLLEKEE